MSLEILEEKEAIRELMDRFSNLECDVKKQSEFFTEDCCIRIHAGGKVTMEMKGREEMVRKFSGFAAAVKASHHMNGQQVIEIHGNTASDIHYCRTVLLISMNGKDYFYDHYLRYEDRLVKMDGIWKIKVRDQYFVMSERREKI